MSACGTNDQPVQLMLRMLDQALGRIVLHRIFLESPSEPQGKGKTPLFLLTPLSSFQSPESPGGIQLEMISH